MLKELGVEYGIVGHSERREYFAETNETVNKKVKAAIQMNIVPVMAYGETEAQYNEGKTLDVVRKQLTEGLVGIDAKEIANIVLAYEPI